MSERQPPRLATWMLSHLCHGLRTDSLIGDLHEQVARGRSAAWYWRQVLFAIGTSARRAVRIHGLSFVAAITTGWAVMYAWYALNMWMTAPHVAAFRFARETLGFASAHPLLMTIWLFTASTRMGLFAVAGWLCVRLHRAHPYLVTATLLASMSLVRWVPWRTYRAFDVDTLATIHNITGIGGLLVGAAWALYNEKRRAQKEHGVRSA
jgi:hypothetical protein